MRFSALLVCRIVSELLSVFCDSPEPTSPAAPAASPLKMILFSKWWESDTIHEKDLSDYPYAIKLEEQSDYILGSKSVDLDLNSTFAIKWPNDFEQFT